MKTVTVISKDECSLCDAAINKINSLRKKVSFNIEVKKIQPGTDEYTRYSEKIPVVILDGNEIFQHRIDEIKLEILLME